MPTERSRDVAVTAAGAVLARRSDRYGLRVAVVHRPRYDDWSLPKGKVKRRESLQRTAIRELREETGYAAVLGRHLGRVRYPVSEGPKTVDYFAATALDGHFEPGREVDRLEWLTPEHAQDRLSYPHDREVLQGFAEHGLALRTLVLVRHAKAGKRDDFDGPDGDRPLDDRGSGQAKALRDTLIGYGPVRVVSAPPLRCVQTVRPVTRALRLELELADDLGEDRYRDDPGAARRFLGELLDAGADRVLLSSQGGVIPGAVRTLACQGGIVVPDVGTPKAAHWVLSFDGDRLVQADLHPAPPEKP